MSGSISQPAGTTVARYAVGSTPTTDFPIPYYFDDKEDLSVWIDGTETTAFTLSGAVSLDGIYTTATVVLDVPVSDVTVVINRDTRAEQDAVFPVSGAFNVRALNRELARLWQAMQDMDRRISTTVRGEDIDSDLPQLPAAADRANYFLAFDSAGNPIVSGIELNDTELTAIGAAVASAASAAAARTAIGAAASNAAVLTGGALLTGGLIADSINTLTLNGGQLAGFRNRIINGGMAIDQRYAGASHNITIATGYGLDRWLVYPTGATVACQQIATGVSSSPYRYRINGAPGVVSVTIRQRIEAANIEDLVGANVVLSWDVLNTVLTTCNWTVRHATARDNFAGLTITDLGSVTVSPVLSRKYVSFTVPAGAVNGLDIAIGFGAQTSGNFEIGNVQLETGTLPTYFENRSRAAEFVLAQRYYEVGQTGMKCPVAGTMQFVHPFKVTKRIAPAVADTLASSTNLSSHTLTPLAFGDSMQVEGVFSAAGAFLTTFAATAEL